MTRSTLNAKQRTVFGRKVKQLRKQQILPANVFGRKTKSQAVQLDQQSFIKTFDQAGETTLVDLVIDKQKPIPVLITNIQVDPVLDTPIHADFHQVDLTEKVTANIPVEIVGESPAVKNLGAVLVTAISEIEVEALPTDLPENFQVDISLLKEFGDNILISSIKTDSKVEIKLDPEEVVVLVQEPKEEVEETPPPEPTTQESETPTSDQESTKSDTTQQPQDQEGGGEKKE